MDATGGLVAIYKLEKDKLFAEHVATGLYWSVSDESGQAVASCAEMWVRKPDVKPPLVAVFFSGGLLSVGVFVGMPQCENGVGGGGFVTGEWKFAVGKFWAPIPPISDKAWVKTVVEEGKLGEGLASLVKRAEGGMEKGVGPIPMRLEVEQQKL